MLGIKACSMSGSLMVRLRVRGLRGAFLLGLAYGVLSGSCTFGFIAPILAIYHRQAQRTAARGVVESGSKPELDPGHKGGGLDIFALGFREIGRFTQLAHP